MHFDTHYDVWGLIGMLPCAYTTMSIYAENFLFVFTVH